MINHRLRLDETVLKDDDTFLPNLICSFVGEQEQTGWQSLEQRSSCNIGHVTFFHPQSFSLNFNTESIILLLTSSLSLLSPDTKVPPTRHLRCIQINPVQSHITNLTTPLSSCISTSVEDESCRQPSPTDPFIHSLIHFIVKSSLTSHTMASSTGFSQELNPDYYARHISPSHSD
jgi:hypothetical protein